jgi:transcription initiation factor TFIIB
MSEIDSAAEETCPVCDGTAVEADVYGLNGICRDCGFVLQAEREAIPDWAIPDGNTVTASRDDWATYCRVENATEQQLAEAFGVIESIANRFQLPPGLREKTAAIYGRAFRAEATDGRETASLVAACLRIASLQTTKPIPTGRLTETKSVDASVFRQSYSVLQSAVNVTAPPVEPVSYLWFLQQVLTIDAQTVETTSDRLEAVESVNSLVGKDPAGIAAAGLYDTADSLTQQTIANAAGVSTETIRLRAGDLREATA